MEFEPHLIEYQPSTKQIPSQLKEMKKLMDSNITPERTLECESCTYLNAGNYIMRIEELDLLIESLLTLKKNAKKQEIKELEKKIEDLEKSIESIQNDV